ncbi:MAG: 8-amino-7-oxononanoate synthase [Chlorobi bacterium]|nr:8-amino-7-oxononanoate synthase [Chlorobiota bacterium]
MSGLLERLRSDLETLDAGHRRRGLRRPGGIDCSSNDYLGIGGHPAVRAAIVAAAAAGVPAGSGGSRLLSGNHEEHERAESLFAGYVGRERSLLFGSGYAANLALLSALPGRHDLILLDAGAHASLKEGARASLAAKRTFRHNDAADLETMLRDRQAFRDVFVVAEGVYSMDGDRAPLGALARIAAERNAHLVVDEAHATGLYGARLRGVHELEGITPLATVHPCGKALGSSGAFIAADAPVIDYLINHARPFLFSTAPPPIQVAGLIAALELLASMADRAAELLGLAARFRARLEDLSRWRIIPSDSPIIPIITGSDQSAVRAAAMIQEDGFDLRPIRPPTVPAGTSRLRVSLTVGMSPGDCDRLAAVILDAERKLEDIA